MKRYLLSLFFILSLFLQIQGFSDSNFAGQNPFNSPSNKVYIQSDQVLISNHGIYVNLEESSSPVPVNDLFYDMGGLFVNYAWHDADPACGHTLGCRRCGGCAPHNRCQYRCKCN